MQYKKAKDEGKSELDALTIAVNFYRHREPFNDLSESEVNKFVDTIYNEQKLNKNIELIKELIIKVMTESESRMDVSIMRKFISDGGYNKVNQNLKSKGWNIFNLLDKYVAIHDDLISKSNTVLSVFKPIDFDKMSKEVKPVAESLIQEKQKLKKIDHDTLSEAQGLYVSCLDMYIDALVNTISLFIKMLNDLEARATNQNDLKLKEHLENDKRYKASIEEYVGIGEELAKYYEQL